MIDVVIVKFVAVPVLHLLELEEHRIKDHEEDGRTQRIALEHASTESKGVGPP